MRRDTPCDLDGICPYSDEPTGATCDYWCHYFDEDEEVANYFEDEFYEDSSDFDEAEEFYDGGGI